MAIFTLKSKAYISFFFLLAHICGKDVIWTRTMSLSYLAIYDQFGAASDLIFFLYSTQNLLIYSVSYLSTGNVKAKILKSTLPSVSYTRPSGDIYSLPLKHPTQSFIFSLLLFDYFCKTESLQWLLLKSEKKILQNKIPQCM